MISYIISGLYCDRNSITIHEISFLNKLLWHLKWMCVAPYITYYCHAFQKHTRAVLVMRKVNLISYKMPVPHSFLCISWLVIFIASIY